MKKILHISAHLGGGFGRAISGLVGFEKRHKLYFTHKIITLDRLEKDQFVRACKADGVEVMAAAGMDVIEREIKKADIVILHWWHHPLMARFLSMFPEVNTRLVFWSHVSGCNYPSLPLEFIEIAHKTLFTTQYTFDNPYWTNSQKKTAKDKSAIVYGLGGLDVNPVKHNSREENGFVIGYIGTLSFGKLHPDFIDYCAAVVLEIPTARFIMVGDTDNRSGVLEQARVRGISQCFEFAGYKEDVSSELSRFDVFGYPLNPYHFGTTENALLEAMAFGLPVVALNQCAERYIIEHGKSGYLAEDKKHYVQLIRYLYDNPSERLRLGENAKKRVAAEFSMAANVQHFHNACDEVLKMKKRPCAFGAFWGQKPYQWFLACLGNDRRLFMDSLDPVIMSNEKRKIEIECRIMNCRHILREFSKSSVCHYARYFPDDENLQYWLRLISKENRR